MKTDVNHLTSKRFSMSCSKKIKFKIPSCIVTLIILSLFLKEKKKKKSEQLDVTVSTLLSVVSDSFVQPDRQRLANQLTGNLINIRCEVATVK